MAKGKDVKKEVKKKPEKSLKEKREEKKAKKAPYGHAELSTLEEFAQKTGMNAEQIVERLNAKNIQGVNMNKTIENIAKENGKSPSELFDIINTPKK